MLGALLGRLLARLSGSEPGDDVESDDDAGGHRPSRLDASVIAGHGGQVGGLDEETSDFEAEARDLEAERREAS
jgi:hypothetical protein